MRSWVLNLVQNCSALILAAILISSCISLPKMTSGPAKDNPPQNRVTPEELHAAVISYANRFFATIGQASTEFEKALPTQSGRIMASNKQVYSLMAAAEIAASPNPGASLLDMVVITALNRIIWEEYWRPQVFGMPATIITDAFASLEKDIWSQAATVMTPLQMEELMDLIQTWRINHPNQVAVDYIRFSDFGDIGKKPNLKAIQNPGGLLAPIREATEAVEEVRMASERAMFLITKMQIIANFQVKLAYKGFLFQPETLNMMKNVDQFSQTAKELGRFVDALPNQLSQERQAILDRMDQIISKERKAILANASDLIKREREALVSALSAEEANAVLKELNKTLDRVDNTLATTDHLILSSQKTGLVFKDLVLSADKLAEKFAAQPNQDPGKPFDINDYIRAMQQFETSSEKLNTLVVSLNKNTDELFISLLKPFNLLAEERMDHIFMRLVQLCLVFGLVILILILVNKQVKPKRSA